MNADHIPFRGAKLILLIGGKLLVIRRDDRADIPWPDHLDFPGGGREGNETPELCVLRETEEEIGLHLSGADLVWRMQIMRPTGLSVFFAAEVGPDLASEIVFGDEGQGWELIPPYTYLNHPRAIPHFADRLSDYLAIRADSR